MRRSLAGYATEPLARFVSAKTATAIGKEKRRKVPDGIDRRRVRSMVRALRVSRDCSDAYPVLVARNAIYFLASYRVRVRYVWMVSDRISIPRIRERRTKRNGTERKGKERKESVRKRAVGKTVAFPATAAAVVTDRYEIRAPVPSLAAGSMPYRFRVVVFRIVSEALTSHPSSLTAPPFCPIDRPTSPVRPFRPVYPLLFPFIPSSRSPNLTRRSASINSLPLSRKLDIAVCFLRDIVLRLRTNRTDAFIISRISLDARDTLYIRIKRISFGK